MATGAAMGAVSLPVLAAASTPATAEIEPVSGVTLSYDESFLKRHRPVFVASYETRRQYKGLYGYKATSPDYDYDVACYWSQLTHQDGLPFVNKDTHLGDHEPLFCYVNPDTGETEYVAMTVYHHIANDQQARENFHWAAYETDEETHPVIQIVDGWHHYKAVESSSWAVGNFPLRDFVAVRETWKDNGFYNRTHDRAVDDPMVMRHRSSWWADGTLDGEIARFWHRLGFGGAETADPVSEGE